MRDYNLANATMLRDLGVALAKEGNHQIKDAKQDDNQAGPVQAQIGLGLLCLANACVNAANMLIEREG